MRLFSTILLTGLLLLTVVTHAADPISGTFKLKDGTEIKGRLFSANNSGIIFRSADSGSLTRRHPYKTFALESLKELMKDAKVARYAAMLLPRDEAAKAAGIKLPPPPSRQKLEPPPFTEVEDRPELPEPQGLMGAIFGTKPGLLLMFLIWGGNIWAGHWIGVYRKQPKFLVPGIAAVAPIVAPIVFMCIKPKKSSKKGAAQEDDEEAAKPAKKKNSAAAAVAKPAAKKKVVTARPAAQAAQPAQAQQAAPAPAQPIAAPAQPAAPAGPKPLEAQAYVKGQVNINKRFIETKFAPFFKLVPDEPYRSAWLCFVTPRGEHWAKRIPKISPTDITLQCPQDGGGTLDTTLQLAEIQEIHLRPPE